jgi:hypothetical protein
VTEEELTDARWMELLDEVREELGEGTIGGIAFGRRLEFTSSLGAWDLSLVEGRLGHWTRYRFTGATSFPAAFYLGPDPDVDATEQWLEIRTGDAAFDAECTIRAATPGPVRRMLSDVVRRSIEELWTFHPSLTLLVHSKSLTMVLPGVLVDRAGIIDFLLAAGACVQELLRSSAGVPLADS